MFYLNSLVCFTSTHANTLLKIWPKKKHIPNLFNVCIFSRGLCRWPGVRIWGIYPRFVLFFRVCAYLFRKMLRYNLLFIWTSLKPLLVILWYMFSLWIARKRQLFTSSQRLSNPSRCINCIWKYASLARGLLVRKCNKIDPLSRQPGNGNDIL